VRYGEPRATCCLACGQLRESQVARGPPYCTVTSPWIAWAAIWAAYFNSFLISP